MTTSSTETRPAPEAENLPGTKLFRVYVVGVTIALAGVVLSTWVLARDRQAHAQHDRRGPGDERTMPRTIGLLEQTTLEQTEVGRVLNARQRAALGRYGWVDRGAGVARIPIDRAIDVVVADPSRR